MQSITITTPDDWHVHLRDNQFLKTTVADTSHFFNRAIIMPNLKPPVTTVDAAHAYLNRIQQCIPDDTVFNPLLTLYLTQDLTADEIKKAKDSKIIFACKLYPQGATTNSNFGVDDIKSIYPVLEAMQEHQLPLLIHGEVAHAHVDIFDREKLFIEDILTPLLKDFPHLKMVLEHISTQTAVEFVLAAPDNVAATITPQHLLLNRNDILAGGIKTHNYCLPVVKREHDRLALVKAATSGNKKFFLGTDSAPHTVETKETTCGCAGIYSAFHAIPLYLEVFDTVNALDKFEAFASHFGAQFYGLPRNTDTITLCKKPWHVPESLPFGDNTVVPLLAGQTLQWQLV
jgi:dihydroorotase